MYQSEVEANSALRRLLNEQRRRLTEQTVALSREVEEGRHRLTLLQTERDGLQSQVRAPEILTSLERSPLTVCVAALAIFRRAD